MTRLESIEEQLKLALAAFLLLSLLACRTSPPADEPENPFTAASTANVTFAGGNGAGCDEAVIVKGAKNETEGVKAEYEWIAHRYPGYKRGMQHMGNCDKKVVDVVQFTTSSGESVRIYFDITEFFGKF